MRKVLSAVAVLFLTFFSNINEGKANHFIGGEITYKHIANDSFVIYLTIYRDCYGTTISTPSLNIKSTCRNQTVAMTLQSVNDVTGIGGNCSIKSHCSGTFQYGIEAHTFYKGINLNDTCCQYTFSWTDCCRTANSLNGSSNPFYIEASLNKCLGANSSPTFKSPPRFLLTQGQAQYISYTATDADSDFVTYHQIPPPTSATSFASYLGQFSEKRPFSYPGLPAMSGIFPNGISFDTATGTFMFLPNKLNEYSTVVIKAVEWRKVNGNWTKVGEITRDLQVFIISANGNSSPDFKTYNNTLTFCSEGPLCFDIPIVDTNSTDTVSVSVTHSINGFTHSISGPPGKPVVKVCYTPDSAAKASLADQYFTINATDNKCPIPGLSQKGFIVKLLPALPDSFAIGRNLSCKNLSLKLINNSHYDSIVPFWVITTPYGTNMNSNSDSLQLTLTDTGLYKISLSVLRNGYCTSLFYYDSVYNSPLNDISVSTGLDTVICADSNITLKTAIFKGTGPFKYTWNTGDSTSNPTVIASVGKNYYSVVVEDAHQCKATDTVKVEYYNPKVKLLGDVYLCLGQTAAILATPTNAIKPTYTWPGFSTTHFQLFDKPTATRTYSVILTDSAGCKATSQYTVPVLAPTLHISHRPAVCSSDTITLTATPTGGLAPYIIAWKPIEVAGPTVFIDTKDTIPPGNLTFDVWVRDNFGCIKIIKDTLLIKPKPTLTISSPGTYCESSGTVNLTSFSTPKGGTWTGTGVAANSFSPQTGAGVYPLVYTYTDPGTGCSNADTTNVSVQAQPKAAFTVDSTTAHISHAFQFTDQTTNPAGAIKWNFGDQNSGSNNTSTFANPTHTFSDTGWYTITLWAAGGNCPNDSLIKTNYIHVYNSITWPDRINDLLSDNIKIYPNPADNKLFIEAGFEITSVKVTDISGRELGMISYLQGEKAEVMVENLSAGTYFIILEGNEGKMATAPFIVAK